MTSRALLARLVHDVGKYVARTARNLPEAPSAEQPIAPALVEMLAGDLYELDGKQPASRVFAALTDGATLPGLEPLRARFAILDALEPEVRRGDPVAVAHAAALAREIEALLRALAKDCA